MYKYKFKHEYHIRTQFQFQFSSSFFSILRKHWKQNSSIESVVKLDAFWSSMKCEFMCFKYECWTQTQLLLIALYFSASMEWCMRPSGRLQTINISHCMYHIYALFRWLSFIICASKLDFVTVFKRHTTQRNWVSRKSSARIWSDSLFSFLSLSLFRCVSSFFNKLHCTSLARQLCIFTSTSELSRDEFSFHEFFI